MYICPSSSDKVTKEILKDWYQDVFFKTTPDHALLILDSWTGYDDKSIINVPENKRLEILRLPPHSTKDIQPLDVYFLRMWKGFIRKISDRIVLDELPIELRLRNNILKLQSLVHNQFSCPIYKEFIKFS